MWFDLKKYHAHVPRSITCFCLRGVRMPTGGRASQKRLRAKFPERSFSVRKHRGSFDTVHDKEKLYQEEHAYGSCRNILVVFQLLFFTLN